MAEIRRSLHASIVLIMNITTIVVYILSVSQSSHLALHASPDIVIQIGDGVWPQISILTTACATTATLPFPTDWLDRLVTYSVTTICLSRMLLNLRGESYGSQFGSQPHSASGGEASSSSRLSSLDFSSMIGPLGNTLNDGLSLFDGEDIWREGYIPQEVSSIESWFHSSDYSTSSGADVELQDLTRDA